jgi:hypothetical protein
VRYRRPIGEAVAVSRSFRMYSAFATVARYPGSLFGSGVTGIEVQEASKLQAIAKLVVG